MLAWIYLVIFWVGCGTQNYGPEQKPKTHLEKARYALDREDYGVAIEEFIRHLEDSPQDYPTFPLLAASYAARAGFGLGALIKNTISQTSAGTLDLGEQLRNLLPDSPPQELFDDIGSALRIIRSMPASERSAQGSKLYQRGSAFQLSYYELIFGLLMVKRFQPKSLGQGNIDSSQLDSMSPEEAKVLLESLQHAVDEAPDTQAGQALKTNAAKRIEAINATEGANEKEKVQNYLKAQALK